MQKPLSIHHIHKLKTNTHIWFYTFVFHFIFSFFNLRLESNRIIAQGFPCQVNTASIRKKRFLFLLFILVLPFLTQAQDGSNDLTFNVGEFIQGYKANGGVSGIALQPDGKVLIGGDFTTVNGTPSDRIARLNSDGSLDSSFNPGTGANFTIFNFALQSDGKILIVGDFFVYNGTARGRIARLNADGSLDTSFNPDTGADSRIWSLVIQPDGKILIVGAFNSYDGVAINRIARLNTDGSLDTSFNPGTGANNIVQSLALQPDGKILIGGLFTSYNGTVINRIARLNSNGSLDTSFNPGTGANDIVQTLALQPDGKILIGGDFSSYNGTTIIRSARLNADGSLDTSFNPGTGANNRISTFALQPDGKILIGGLFNSYNGTTINRIARLSADGSLDTSFNPGSGPLGTVRTLVLQPDDKILVGGSFASYDGVSRNGVSRLLNDLRLNVLINSIEILTNSSVVTRSSFQVRAISGDLALIEKGLVYSDALISNNPSLETNGIGKIVHESTSIANFDLTISNLSPNNRYIAKAYARTTDGKIFYSSSEYFSTNTAPVFDHSLSDGVLEINSQENSTAVLDILATDPDQGQSLAFSLQGTDAALFELNQATRQLTFKAAPDFEDPKDQNKDNVYELAVIATDNAPLPKSSTLMIRVRVTNEAEISSIQTKSFSDLGSKGAKLNATIVHNGGGGTIIASGFVLSATSANSAPQLGGTGVTAYVAGATQGDFSNLVFGLQPGTSYSYRAYATNGVGTAYSEVATFTTLMTADASPVFGYAPALLNEIDKTISAIQPEILGSEVPGDIKPMPRFPLFQPMSQVQEGWSWMLWATCMWPKEEGIGYRNLPPMVPKLSSDSFNPLNL